MLGEFNLGSYWSNINTTLDDDQLTFTNSPNKCSYYKIIIPDTKYSSHYNLAPYFELYFDMVII